ncbi:MAG TPA: hypothetical protein VHW24_09300 [Bryobacteraceae bacterium]|nr:hypothetical protein [Bryobacteraceae bacterium]
MRSSYGIATIVIVAIALGIAGCGQGQNSSSDQGNGSTSSNQGSSSTSSNQGGGSSSACSQLAGYFSDPKVVAAAQPLTLDQVRQWEQQNKSDLCERALGNLRAGGLVPAAASTK